MRDATACAVLQLITQLSKAFIRDQSTRRSLMFYSMLGALLWLFLGATFFDRWLRERPLLFLIFWGACAWVTLLALLLALFDLLLVRAAARRARQELARELLEKPIKPDENAH